jgi:hypothetical protein
MALRMSLEYVLDIGHKCVLCADGSGCGMAWAD